MKETTEEFPRRLIANVAPAFSNYTGIRIRRVLRVYEIIKGIDS